MFVREQTLLCLLYSSYGTDPGFDAHVRENQGAYQRTNLCEARGVCRWRNTVGREGRWCISVPPPPPQLATFLRQQMEGQEDPQTPEISHEPQTPRQAPRVAVGDTVNVFKGLVHMYEEIRQ